jgi:hypothetical protein
MINEHADPESPLQNNSQLREVLFHWENFSSGKEQALADFCIQTKPEKH